MTPVIIILAVAVLAAVAMNYHFMLTKNGLKVIKKASWGVADTFVDTRNWGPIDWMKHADILDAMVNDTLNDLKKDLGK
jgi:hypothetical protein